MIESVDPITLPLWLIAAFAALQYPLGLMFGAECSLCCCRKCSGNECCGDEWPRPVGVCCDSIWHLDEGVCCDNVWHTDEGVCCNDEWQTGVGVCCDDVWYPSGSEGECCTDIWRTTLGNCCKDVWYPEDSPCPLGKVYFEKGDCCGCVNEQTYDPRIDEMVDTVDLLSEMGCAPECNRIHLAFDENGNDLGELGRCCVEDTCSAEYESVCDELEGEWFDDCNCTLGCLVPCCTETADDEVVCEVKFSGLCKPPSAAGAGDCETGCLGACCVDGEYIGQTTKSECNSSDGCWAGVGSTVCQADGTCRSPFDAQCCESVVSTAAGLTFTQPRQKRCPPFADTFLVTVTGTTDSPVLIHGVPFGVNATPAKRCPFNLSFHLCWDKFNIEPDPCDSNFRRLDVTVCWEEVHTSIETLAFPTCSDTVVWLGSCTRSCATTLVYNGSGVTSSNTIYTYGDAIIEANGVGALVIGTDIVPVSACNRTLTLSGSSTAVNEIGNIDQVLFTTTSLVKSGVGTWKLTESSTYGGTSVIKSGTLIVGVNTLPNAGAFGTGGGFVTLGDDSEYIAGSATLLLDAGITMGKWVRVPDVGVSSTQTVTIAGNAGAAFNDSTSWIYVGRDITLTSATGGTFEFRNKWTDYLGIAEPSVDITVGAAGLLGEVLVTNHLSTTGTIAVGYGRLHFGGGAGRAENVSAVIIDGDAAELEYTSSTPMYWPAVTLGQGSLLGTGVIADLSLASDPTIDAYATGSGEFQITGTLSGSGTLTKTGSGTLRISGTNTYLGEIDIDAGSVVVEQIVNGPGGLVSSATFTPSSLVVDFLDDPATGDEFQLLAGAVSQTYGSVTLTGTAATGTFNSATSTLTID